MELLFALNWLTNPASVAAIESLAVCDRLVCFVSTKGQRTVGDLYSFNLESGPVELTFF